MSIGLRTGSTFAWQQEVERVELVAAALILDAFQVYRTRAHLWSFPQRVKSLGQSNAIEARADANTHRKDDQSRDYRWATRYLKMIGLLHCVVLPNPTTSG
ncbi:hypothetical protein [Neorhodopirellula lusitana]|uniref:hypothetical protein n=1 Tax=Neorhodopirellula lusitana TaxID=445327 RepID=UPI00384DA2B9